MPVTLRQAVNSELLLKKSRFIGCVAPIDDRPAAVRRVAQLRAEHPGAAHVCWALLAGGHSAAVDDGEPGGTAGRPMLDVLRHQNLDGVLATVVRYFGGVKLGASGLVRAYTDCVAQALLNAEKVECFSWTSLRCLIPYPLEGWMRRELAGADAQSVLVTHASVVDFRFKLTDAQAEPFRHRISEAGQGKVVWVDD